MKPPNIDGKDSPGISTCSGSCAQVWPLYYFIGDTRPGYAAGNGYGGVWFAAVLENTDPLSLQPLPRPNLPVTNPLSPATPNVAGNPPQLQNPAPLVTPRPVFPRFGGGGGRGRR